MSAPASTEPSVRHARGHSAATLYEAGRVDAGVAVVPGEAFDAPGHLRLCFAVSPDTLDTAAARLGEHLDRAGSRG